MNERRTSMVKAACRWVTGLAAIGVLQTGSLAKEESLREPKTGVSGRYVRLEIPALPAIGEDRRDIYRMIEIEKVKIYGRGSLTPSTRVWLLSTLDAGRKLSWYNLFEFSRAPAPVGNSFKPEPFVVRWPGVVRSGSVCHRLVHQADVLATLAEIWNAKLPDNAGEDSFSFLPLLKGVDHPVRETAVSCAGGGIPSLRQGAWKLVFAADPQAKTTQQLYNLDDDIGETKNLAADQPERVVQMRALMEQLIVDGRSTPGTKQKNDVEVSRHSRTMGLTQSKDGTKMKSKPLNPQNP